MDLIPGLTDDLARECLIRIPFKSLHSLLSVSKAWNSEIQSPEFQRHRKSSGQTRPVFVLAKTQQSYFHETGLILILTVFNPDSGSWTRLPNGPGLPVEFSALCGVVGVGSKVVVISVEWYERSELVNNVHVYDFLTGQWSRGADVPGPGRLRFRLGGDPVRQRAMLAGGFGIGGYFNAKRTTMSAFMYDVANDTWTQLGDIKKERDECIVVCHGGKFHVISGFSSPPREKGVESLDLDTLEWGPIDDGFLGDSMGEGFWTVTGNGEEELYYMGRNVEVRRGGKKWEVVSEVSNEIRVRKCVMTWRDKMVVIAGKEVNKAYVLDPKNGEWSNEDVRDEYSKDGNVLGCGMEL